MIEQFTQDIQRAKLISELTMEFYNNGHNIFVFADRREYLLEINKHLNQLHLSSQILTDEKEAKKLQSIRLVGGSSEEEMTIAKESKSIILTTYQYMSTGCSIPKMTCIILATPRRSKSGQTINRIFRLGSDYSIVRQIVDIIDWKTTLKSQWHTRKKYYDSQNFTFEVRTIKAKDPKV
jgi:superfamily II DNA or RNA helicase